MILTVGNTKGGVGKTTLALNIAIARALAGKNVWLIDADIQDTAKTAIAARAEAEIEPAISFAKYPEATLLRSQVRQQAERFDDVVIDVGGRDTGALRAAIFLSDVLLVPFEPHTFEVWAMADIAAIIAEARDVRDGLTAYAVVNCGDNSVKSTDNKDAAEAVAEFPELSLLPSIIHSRKAFANEGGKGMSVLEAKRKDKKAIDELNGLMAHLFPQHLDGGNMKEEFEKWWLSQRWPEMPSLDKWGVNLLALDVWQARQPEIDELKADLQIKVNTIVEREIVINKLSEAHSKLLAENIWLKAENERLRDSLEGK